MAELGVASLKYDKKWLQITFTNGEVGNYYVQWLRDNIPSGRHQNRGQRTFDINSLPQQFLGEVTYAGSDVSVTFEPDAQKDVFSIKWLYLYRAKRAANKEKGPYLWAAGQQEELFFADYEAILNSKQELHAFLVHVRDYGYGLLENVPLESGQVLNVVELFGYVRQTNYGKLFEVRAQPNPSNLAFTNRAIGMHTDNPYRAPVPGLQLLHCLKNESDGGESQLVDGFWVAQKIRQNHPEAFSLLSTHPVRFRYVEKGLVDLEATSPLIELDSRGEVVAIRYNSRSAQTFSFGDEVMEKYYSAYRLLGDLLHEPEARIEFRLGAGQLMIFDNHRVLHGRSGYEQGGRHLQGCYADKDSLQSLIRAIETDK